MTDLYSALVAIVWGLHGPESVPYTIRNHWRKALLYQHRFDVNIREIYIYAVFWSWYKEMSITPFCETRPFELLGGKISRTE